jgi:hypothetical protein
MTTVIIRRKKMKPTTTINIEVLTIKPPEPFPIVDLLNVKNHEELKHCLDYFLESLTDDNEGEKILEAYEYTMKLSVHWLSKSGCKFESNTQYLWNTSNHSINVSKFNY